MALGATGVPSLYGLNQTQERIENLFGNPTEQATAAPGNIFLSQLDQQCPCNGLPRIIVI